MMNMATVFKVFYPHLIHYIKAHGFNAAVQIQGTFPQV
jgi:hypothetical protein